MQIAAGHDSCYALLDDGSIWAWGKNDNGQLGDGTTTDRPSPVRITSYGADTGMRLPSGGSTAETVFVVMANGTAMGSGSNYDGQMATDGWSVETAVAISELGGGITQIARGSKHTLVLKGE